MSEAAVVQPADPRWGGHDGLFGGYAVALLVDAVVATETAGGRVASVAASFVGRTELDEARVVLDRVHDGRATGLVRAALVQGRRPRVHASVEVLRGAATEPRWVGRVEPSARPDVSAETRHDYMAVNGLLELRMAAPPALDGVVEAWARLRPGAEDCGLASQEALLACLLDLPTPGLFGERPAPEFVPSLDYVVHYSPLAAAAGPAATAAGEWRHLRHATAWATDTHCVDEAVVSTADGRMLAQLRQTRAVRW